VSFRFNGHFARKPGLVGFVAAKDDGSGGDNWNYKPCRAPVKSSDQHRFFQPGYRSCRPTYSVIALKGKYAA